VLPVSVARRFQNRIYRILDCLLPLDALGWTRGDCRVCTVGLENAATAVCRVAAVLLLSAVSVIGAELKIDHATVAGTHLDALRQAFTSASGVHTEYGGPHANHATEMALVSFPDGSYLEFMGIQAQADPSAVAAHTWSRFLRNNGGPCAFALRVPDTAAEVARLKAAGVPVGAPERSGRTRPDGTVLSWETADVGPGPRGTVFPFLIRDLTPRANRVYPSGKPSTDRFRGVGQVVVGVHDLDGNITLYRRAFGLPEPHRQRDNRFGAELAWFEGTPIVLAQGLGEGSWLTRRVREYGDGPAAFILASQGGWTGAGRLSQWFGKPVLWMDEAALGWRLGIESGR
jgi:catechol 2,3-dioxygenase-like lactoylglutathione lyase family enzyme